MSEIFVGIDLGGTNIKIGLFDSELKLVSKTSVATKVDMGPNVVIDKMAQTTKKLLVEAGLSLQDVVAVGIGTPGPAKYSEGIIIRSTNMPKFKNVPICKMLNEKLGADKASLQAQLAYVDAGQVRLHEVMLPYVQMGEKTLFELMEERGFKALPSPTDD